MSGWLRRMEWPETRARNRREGVVSECLRRMEWPEGQAITADGVKNDVRRTACVIWQGYARLQSGKDMRDCNLTGLVAL